MKYLLLTMVLSLSSCARPSSPGNPVTIESFDPGQSLVMHIMASTNEPVEYELAWDGAEQNTLTHPVTLSASVTRAGQFSVSIRDERTGATVGSHEHLDSVILQRGTKPLLPFITSRQEGEVTIWFQHAFADQDGKIILRLTVFGEQSGSHNQRMVATD
jgi:hypothetical protein